MYYTEKDRFIERKQAIGIYKRLLDNIRILERLWKKISLLFVCLSFVYIILIYNIYHKFLFRMKMFYDYFVLHCFKNNIFLGLKIVDYSLCSL